MIKNCKKKDTAPYLSVKLSFLTVLGFHVRWPVLLIFKTKIHDILRKIAARKIVDSEKLPLISRFFSTSSFFISFRSVQPHSSERSSKSLAGMQDHLSVLPVSSSKPI